ARDIAHHCETEGIRIDTREAWIVETRLEDDAGMQMQELQHLSLTEAPLGVQAAHDLVMTPAGAALVHHLGLLLRLEIGGDRADDADQFALPVGQGGRMLLDEIKDVLL